MIIDFHTHTTASDGELIPSELVRRAFVNGYTAIGLSDHLDFANFDQIVPVALTAAKELSRAGNIAVLPGVEITHVPPEDIARLIAEVRKAGIKIVVVHGETCVEPVAPLTNLRAIEARADILAHPGFITAEEVALAKRNGVLLEISARPGNNVTNGHVARLAREIGAPLIASSDTHSPHNLFTASFHRAVCLGAGLTEEEYEKLLMNAQALLDEAMKK